MDKETRIKDLNIEGLAEKIRNFFREGKAHEERRLVEIVEISSVNPEENPKEDYDGQSGQNYNTGNPTVPLMYP